VQQWWRFIGGLELNLELLPSRIERPHLGLALVYGDLAIPSAFATFSTRS